MGKFVPFAPIARWAGNHEIIGVIRASFTSNRNDMINIVAPVKFLVAIITFALLSLELLLDVLWRVSTRNSLLSRAAIASMHPIGQFVRQSVRFGYRVDLGFMGIDVAPSLFLVFWFGLVLAAIRQCAIRMSSAISPLPYIAPLSMEKSVVTIAHKNRLFIGNIASMVLFFSCGMVFDLIGFAAAFSTATTHSMCTIFLLVEMIGCGWQKLTTWASALFERGILRYSIHALRLTFLASRPGVLAHSLDNNILPLHYTTNPLTKQLQGTFVLSKGEAL